MDKSIIKIKVKTKQGKIKKTLDSHESVEDLLKDIDKFLKETEEAIKAGHDVCTTCSNCCNWNIITKIKAILKK